MGAWPLPTGDSLVVPSRAQVNLLGPCDRSFQTTPLTMSSAARPIARETPSPGAARHIGMAACNRRRVLQIRRYTPDRDVLLRPWPVEYSRPRIKDSPITAWTA
jgi:hypothetical protein